MTRPQIQHKQNYSTNAVPSHMEIMTLKTEKPSQNSLGCQAWVQQLRLSGKLSLSWCFNLPCSEEREREREGCVPGPVINRTLTASWKNPIPSLCSFLSCSDRRWRMAGTAWLFLCLPPLISISRLMDIHAPVPKQSCEAHRNLLREIISYHLSPTKETKAVLTKRGPKNSPWQILYKPTGL